MPFKNRVFRKVDIKGSISFSSYSNNKHIILCAALWLWERFKKQRQKEKKANACHVIAGPGHPFFSPRSHKWSDFE